jgi:bacterioferritin-associated ferredoxin
VYVCLCRGVSDRKIRAAIGEGAHDVAEVGRRTTAGTVCHECHPAIEELLRGAREPERPADLSAGRGANGRTANGGHERGSTA